MAAAVFSGQNELYWAEPKVYKRKYTNPNNQHLKYKADPNLIPNPNPNPNPNPSRKVHDSSSSKINGKKREETPCQPSSRPPVEDDTPSLRDQRLVVFDDCNASSYGGYVTFNVSACTKRELMELKSRLVSELEEVQGLLNRIESTKSESRSGYPGSQFSNGFDRETNSVARPPPVQVNHSLDSSPGSNDKRTQKAGRFYPPSDSLTGKNKMKQSEKKKKLSGSKRPVSPVSCREPKRPMAKPTMEKPLMSMMRRCGQILGGLMKHKFGPVFNTPVDAVELGLFDYHQIIKHPMDLGTVNTKLRNGVYASPLDFAADVRLTYDNAMLYNPKNQDVHLMAQAMLSNFNKAFSPLQKKLVGESSPLQKKLVGESSPLQKKLVGESSPLQKKLVGEKRQMMAAAAEETQQRQCQRSVAEAPSSARAVESLRRPEPMPIERKSDTMLAAKTLPRPPPVQMQPSLTAPVHEESFKPRQASGKLPKPKPRDPNKRPMSYEEKIILSFALQDLPEQKNDQLVNIVKKRNGVLVQEGDEIELNFEVMDNETLWELDRFVSNHNKMKPQEIVGNEISEAQIINKSPENEMQEADVQNNNIVEPMEEDIDIDIGEEIPVNNFPPTEIERDNANASSGSSSSSSSSSSGGSSSSSDSDSASSDSDADSAQSPHVELKEAPET